MSSGCLHTPPDAPKPDDPPALTGGADLHVHLNMRDSLPMYGRVDGPQLATDPDQWLENQVTTAALHRAGIQVIVSTIWPPFDLRPGQTKLDVALYEMTRLRHFGDDHPGYAIARDAAEARRLREHGLIVLLPHLEGAEAIETVDDVDRLYAAGFRAIGLVHFTSNAIADAHADQFGHAFSRLMNGEDEGLTPLGRDAVHRMIALGMLIDVGHCSDRTRDDVLSIAETEHVPIIDSHVGPDWTSPWTIADAQVKRIAALGGLVGIGIYRYDGLMSAPESERWPGFEPTTCDDTVAMWLHYAKLVGPEHVVLGSDLNSAIHRPRAGGQCKHGLRNAGDLPELYEALEKKGFPRSALESQADRVLQLFERVESRANPAEQGRAVRLGARFNSPLDLGF